jgi:predicted metal-binding protein
MPAPVERAMIFICQKCGKRAGGALKHASYELASTVKRATKHEFGKGKVRVCLTSCMDACPEEHIAVSLQQVGNDGSSMFFEADVHDIEGASDALMQLMRLGCGVKS